MWSKLWKCHSVRGIFSSQLPATEEIARAKDCKGQNPLQSRLGCLQHISDEDPFSPGDGQFILGAFHYCSDLHKIWKKISVANTKITYGL